MSITCWNGWSTFALTSLHNNPQTAGLAWATSEDRTCTGSRFYRTSDMAAGQLPTRARVWRNSDGHVMADLALTPATGASSWIDFDWAVPFTAAASVQYRLGIDFPGGFSYVASDPTSVAPSPPVPLSLQANGKYVQEPPGFPDTASSLWFGVDVVLSGDALAGSGGTAGTGGTTTTGDLNAWLSDASTVNTHQSDGLPWRTDANVTTVKGEAEGVNGFAAIKAVADAIASAVAGLPGTIAGAVTTITGQITAMSANIFDHAVTGLTAISGDVRSVENHALDVLAGMVTFPGTSPHYAWTAGDPIGFDQCVAVAVPAEAYHLEILSHPRHPLNQVCGVNMVYRSGWWCELSGEIGAERHYIDFEKTLLRDGSRRLPGILVSLEPGFSGVVTPYTLEAV